MSMHQTALTIAVIVLATQMTRWLPFIVFTGNKKLPSFVSYLALVLPLTALAILVVYCLKDLQWSLPTDLLCHTLAITVLIGLHLWQRKTLLSILGGTLCYMIMLQIFG